MIIQQREEGNILFFWYNVFFVSFQITKKLSFSRAYPVFLSIFGIVQVPRNQHSSIYTYKTSTKQNIITMMSNNIILSYTSSSICINLLGYFHFRAAIRCHTLCIMSFFWALSVFVILDFFDQQFGRFLSFRYMFYVWHTIISIIIPLYYVIIISIIIIIHI